jgi:hypothetical protein
MFGPISRLGGAHRPPFFAGGYPKIIAPRGAKSRLSLPAFVPATRRRFAPSSLRSSTRRLAGDQQASPSGRPFPPLEATLRLVGAGSLCGCLGVGSQGFRSETFGYGKPHDKIKENAPRKGVFLYRFVGVRSPNWQYSFEDAGCGLTKTLGGNIRAAGLPVAGLFARRRPLGGGGGGGLLGGGAGLEGDVADG